MMNRIGNRELLLVLLAAVLTLAAAGAVILRDTTPEWKYYQAEFRAIVAEEIGVDRSQVPAEGRRLISCSRYLQKKRCSAPSRTPTHDSGPVWVATPSP